jgi:hypothetical protein
VLYFCYACCASAGTCTLTKPSSGGGGTVTCQVNLLYQQELVLVRVAVLAPGRELVTGTGEWTSFTGVPRKRVASAEVVATTGKVWLQCC